MKTTNKLLFELQDGVYDSCIEAVTGPGSDSRMRESLEAALHGFEGDFGKYLYTALRLQCRCWENLPNLRMVLFSAQR